MCLSFLSLKEWSDYYECGKLRWFICPLPWDLLIERFVCPGVFENVIDGGKGIGEMSRASPRVLRRDQSVYVKDWEGNFDQGVVWSGVLRNREHFMFSARGPTIQKCLRKMHWAVLCWKEDRAREDSSSLEYTNLWGKKDLCPASCLWAFAHVIPSAWNGPGTCLPTLPLAPYHHWLSWNPRKFSTIQSKMPLLHQLLFILILFSCFIFLTLITIRR